MERQQKTITLLLVVALLFGTYNSFQLRSLQRMVNDAADRTSREITSAQNSIQSAVWGINSSISQMREEERWVYPASYAAIQSESSADGVVLELSWSFRELQRGSEVYLLYRPYTKSSPVEWTRVEANVHEDAAYNARVTLYPMLEYEYQIVVEGDLLRSTQAVGIPTNLYQPHPLRITSWGGNVDREGKWIGDLQFEVEQPYLSLFEFLNAQDVFLTIGREDGTSARVDASNGNREGYKAWFFNIAAEGLATMKLGVTYGDGATYFKELPLTENWWSYHSQLEFSRGDSKMPIIQP